MLGNGDMLAVLDPDVDYKHLVFYMYTPSLNKNINTYMYVYTDIIYAPANTGRIDQVEH
jgi:hypothetical protein